jgi:hypothetical protein
MDFYIDGLEAPVEFKFPYLSPHQPLTQPTAWQQELANAIEGVFSKGARERGELIAGLNASRCRRVVANGRDSAGVIHVQSDRIERCRYRAASTRHRLRCNYHGVEVGPDGRC